jgi:FdhD protein
MKELAVAVDQVKGASSRAFAEHFADGAASVPITRALAEEAPVAIEINGMGYAVMMATPADLEDYALGFCLSEQLIADAAASCRRRRRRFRGAAGCCGSIWRSMRRRPCSNGRGCGWPRDCGLCGIESLEQVLRPLPQVQPREDVADAAIFRATAALADHQRLGRATRAAHAAAFCAPDGTILAVREDVGRHNAFDKLIGALARAGPIRRRLCRADRAVQLELVQKAVIAGVGCWSPFRRRRPWRRTARAIMACGWSALHGGQLSGKRNGAQVLASVDSASRSASRLTGLASIGASGAPASGSNEAWPER